MNTTTEPLSDERLEEIRSHLDEYGFGRDSLDANAVVTELLAEVDRLRVALKRAVDHASAMEDQRAEWRSDACKHAAEVRELRAELDAVRGQHANAVRSIGGAR